MFQNKAQSTDQVELSIRDKQLLYLVDTEQGLNEWNRSNDNQHKLMLLLKTKVNAKKLLPAVKSIDFSEVILEDVSVDIVDGCNLRCIGCPNSTLKPSVSPYPPK